MSRVFVPDRFIVRSPDEFSAALDLVGGQYWHRARRGELDSALGVQVRGAYEAVQWLAGVREVPPGFMQARLRTRFDLLQVLAVTELAVSDPAGRWESTVRGNAGGALEYFDAKLAAGARAVYEWALGLRAELGYAPLLPEDLRAAREHAQAQLRRAARIAEADAASPYAHLRGELQVPVTVFERAVRDGERQLTEGGYASSPMAAAYEGALAVGHWILGEAGHPVTGAATPATRAAIADTVHQVVDAVYRERRFERGFGQGMVDMLHFALGQRDEAPVRWVGPDPTVSRAA